MKLIFLGSGSAFTIGEGNYHSNMLLVDEKDHGLLIDCGSDVRFSLNELGLSHRDIHDVYVSHFHADHVGGLEWLAFTTKFDPHCQKPNLYLCENMVDDLWEKVLSGGLSSLQGEVAELSTYFNVHPVPENGGFTWHGLQINLVQTMHTVSGFTIMPSYGVTFRVNHMNIFITTDTQAGPAQIRTYYDMMDLIFHDCETAKTHSGVHAHYSELLKLPEATRKKMWLYHYNPGKLPDVVKDGFRGLVKKGQVFDFNDPSTLGPKPTKTK